MPLNKYFGGKGASVMKDMQGRYGAKKGKSVFYATAQKEDRLTPGDTRDAKKVKRHARRKKHKRYSHARSRAFTPGKKS